MVDLTGVVAPIKKKMFKLNQTDPKCSKKFDMALSIDFAPA